MNDDQIRAMLVEALESAHVLTLREQDRKPGFLQARRDISIAELEIDSLAAMELCIAVEINSGVSIVPEDLQAIGSLEGLVAIVREALS